MDKDFRVGNVWYSLATGWFHEGYTGTRPLHSRRRSIFPGRQNSPGLPGILNVRDDDLRWGIDSFIGGEGQRVIDPSDDTSFTRYDRSVGLDVSNPGELRIAKAMQVKGSSGSGAVNTVEASSWVDDLGTSTVVGTDRKLNAVAGRVRDDISLPTGLHQIDFYAYEDGPQTYDGAHTSQFVGPTSDHGTTKRLDATGAEAGRRSQTPVGGAGGCSVRALVSGAPVIPIGPGGPPAAAGPCSLVLTVYDHESGNVVQTSRASIAPGEDRTMSVNFSVVGGHSYDYTVKARDLNGQRYAIINSFEEDPSDERDVTWSLLLGTTVLSSGLVKLNGTTAAGTKVGSCTVTVAAGPTTYRLKLARTAGASRAIFADKAMYRQITMNDPRVVELGLDDRIWLGDYAAALAPNLLYWDPQTDKWIASGSFGAAGDVLGAMGHSDHFEYVTNITDKKVYKATRGAGAVPATLALPETPVGVCVGGNRLLILTESTADGTQLYEHDLEAAAGAPTLKDTPGNKGVSVDTESPQRMAATNSGAVFFANQGPDCWVYLWDGSAGVALTKGPPGFRGQAIVHAAGDTWLGGALPSVTIDGSTQYRPVILYVPGDGSRPLLLDVKLHREDDVAGSRIVAMQLYGTDLWVSTEVAGAVPSMRLWRISLRSPIASFCQQEIITDQPQVGGHLRGLAITWNERIIAWSVGPPYMETQDYASTGFLRTSVYGFGLSEEKELLSLDLVAEIPDGCSVVLSYSADGGAPQDVTYTMQGRQKITSPELPVFATTLSIDIRLNSNDRAQSPVVYTVMPRGFLAKEAQQLLDVVLECLNPGSPAGAFVWTHPDGDEKRGAYGVENLNALARFGAVVEFEDAYTDPQAPRVGVASIVDVDLEGIGPGEGLAHVTLLEE